MSWTVLLGYFTGLRLLNPEMDPGTLLRTTFVVHSCDAAMCRLFAHNNGYPKNLWTLLGFLFGIWGVAILVLLPTRRAVPGIAGGGTPAHAREGTATPGQPPQS